MGFYKKEVTADVRLDVRVNAAEKAEIKERASRACLSVSDYVRRCALGKRVDMRYDAVSYTHLDVYKRQALFTCQKPRMEVRGTCP